MTSIEADASAAADSPELTSLSHRPRSVRRATLLSAIALFLFPVLFFVKSATASVIGISIGIVLGAGAFGILVASLVLKALAAKTRQPIVFAGIASAVVVALPGLSVVLGGGGEPSLFVYLLPGGIFIGVHVALLGVYLLAPARNVVLLFLILLSLVGSAGPFLLLFGVVEKIFGLWLSFVAAACDLPLGSHRGWEP